MLEALAVIFVFLWALGYFSAHTGGGLIHILLVIAIVAFLVRMI